LLNNYFSIFFLFKAIQKHHNFKGFKILKNSPGVKLIHCDFMRLHFTIKSTSLIVHAIIPELEHCLLKFLQTPHKQENSTIIKHTKIYYH